MSRVVLISCGKRKSLVSSKAKDLYQGELFRKSLEYARSLRPDKIFILSAKHGLVDLEQKLAPYEETLNTKSDKEIREWSERVVRRLFKLTKPPDQFIFLAGERYRKYLIPSLKNYRVPMKGLGIGKQLAWLKKKNSKNNFCEDVHFWARGLKHFRYPFNSKKIPNNGIYIMFEKGERGHGGERIVRVGSHTGEGQLPSRLEQHYLNENKDRSIFRKNIGRALICKNGGKHLADWEIDRTPAVNRGRNPVNFIPKWQIALEKKISAYIRKNISFVTFRTDKKTKRISLERNLIGSISSCSVCRASKKWLGLNSPVEKIRGSGLWQVQHLYVGGLDSKQLKKLILARG